MAWTAPRTWAVGEAITADLLNEQLRDNMNAMLAPPSANYEPNEASDYSITTETTFTDVDATNLALTINTNGGDVMVHFHGMVRLLNTSANDRYLHFDVVVDGSVEGGDDGITGVGAQTNTISYVPVSFTRLITGLAAGSHTFKLQWKLNNSSSASAVLYAGAGTSSLDLHPQFWAREIS